MEEFGKTFGSLSDFPGVYIAGRLAVQEARALVGASDFSILFRHPKRYAKAGHSTKFAESLLLGTPVICNSVGSGDRNIVDGINGIKISRVAVDEIESALLRVLEMSDDARFEMRKQARLTGEKIYTDTSYQARVQEFLTRLTSKQ